MDEIIEAPSTPKRYFKGTLEQYTELNSAISARFHYPSFATENYYPTEPKQDIEGKFVMEIDGFIQDMMPEVFEGIELFDTVEYPTEPDETV